MRLVRWRARAAVRDLDGWARDDQEANEADPIVALGQEAATTARRLGELQRLYRIRLEVTQEALENLRRAATP